MIYKEVFFNKAKLFFAFNIVFFYLFLSAYGGDFHRTIKLALSIVSFAVMLTIIADEIKEVILPILTGTLYFFSNGIIVYFYMLSKGLSYTEIHYELFFACGLTVFLTAVFKLIGNKFFLISIFESTVFIISLFQIVYYTIYNAYLDSDAIYLILQTNIKEAWTFSKEYIFCVFFYVVLVCCYGYIINKVNNRLKNNTKNCKIVLIVLFVCIFIMYIFIFKDAQLMLYRNYKIADGYLKQIEMMSSFDSNINEIKTDSNIKNIVIVIGESACRDYMNVYGYNRDNTPWMSSNKGKNNWLFFKNVYSCSKATNKSLAYVLTQKSQYNHYNLYESLNIVDVLKASGFKTYWISKQGNLSNHREVYNVIAQRADNKYFLEGNYNDFDLVKFLDINSDDKKVIFIHLLGSHHPYKYYPENFKKYKDDNVNDNYDNSIYFTDYVLREIFNKVGKNAGVFIYFSDHGESKDMLRNQFDFRMERIPFVVYCSDDFIDSNKEVYENMVCKIDSYFTTDMLYDTILNMVKIDNKYYDEKQAFFSNQYSFYKEKLKTEYGKISIQEDPYD